MKHRIQNSNELNWESQNCNISEQRRKNCKQRKIIDTDGAQIKRSFQWVRMQAVWYECLNLDQHPGFEWNHPHLSSSG